MKICKNCKYWIKGQIYNEFGTHVIKDKNGNIVTKDFDNEEMIREGYQHDWIPDVNEKRYYCQSLSNNEGSIQEKTFITSDDPYCGVEIYTTSDFYCAGYDRSPK